jgi:hypothetical protein
MATYANIFPAAETGGITYVSGVSLPTTEADLLSPAVPVPLPYKCGLSVGVELTITGAPASNTSYVVLQTDFGDSVWYDVAWCLLTSTSNATYDFLLSAGIGGANAFQMSRTNGSAPSSSSSNQCLLGPRIRFTGQKALSGGTSPDVKAKVIYHPLPLR